MYKIVSASIFAPNAEAVFEQLKSCIEFLPVTPSPKRIDEVLNHANPGLDKTVSTVDIVDVFMRFPTDQEFQVWAPQLAIPSTQIDLGYNYVDLSGAHLVNVKHLKPIVRIDTFWDIFEDTPKFIWNQRAARLIDFWNKETFDSNFMTSAPYITVGFISKGIHLCGVAFEFDHVVVEITEPKKVPPLPSTISLHELYSDNDGSRTSIHYLPDYADIWRETSVKTLQEELSRIVASPQLSPNEWEHVHKKVMEYIDQSELAPIRSELELSISTVLEPFIDRDKRRFGSVISQSPRAENVPVETSENGSVAPLAVEVPKFPPGLARKAAAQSVVDATTSPTPLAGLPFESKSDSRPATPLIAYESLQSDQSPPNEVVSTITVDQMVITNTLGLGEDSVLLFSKTPTDVDLALRVEKLMKIPGNGKKFKNANTRLPKFESIVTHVRDALDDQTFNPDRLTCLRSWQSKRAGILHSEDQSFLDRNKPKVVNGTKSKTQTPSPVVVQPSTEPKKSISSHQISNLVGRLKKEASNLKKPISEALLTEFGTLIQPNNLIYQPVAEIIWMSTVLNSLSQEPPQCVCDAFKNALKEFKVDSSMQQIENDALHNQLSKTVLPWLGEIYSHGNEKDKRLIESAIHRESANSLRIASTLKQRIQFTENLDDLLLETKPGTIGALFLEIMQPQYLSRKPSKEQFSIESIALMADVDAKLTSDSVGKHSIVELCIRQKKPENFVSLVELLYNLHPCVLSNDTLRKFDALVGLEGEKEVARKYLDKMVDHFIFEILDSTSSDTVSLKMPHFVFLESICSVGTIEVKLRFAAAKLFPDWVAPQLSLPKDLAILGPIEAIVWGFHCQFIPETVSSESVLTLCNKLTNVPNEIQKYALKARIDLLVFGISKWLVITRDFEDIDKIFEQAVAIIGEHYNKCDANELVELVALTPQKYLKSIESDGFDKVNWLAEAQSVVEDETLLGIFREAKRIEEIFENDAYVRFFEDYLNGSTS